jgi:hypothetical protein
MTNPVAPVVTDEMVNAAEDAYDQAAYLDGCNYCYLGPMRAAITAALEASGELERLRAALQKAEIEREYWRGCAVLTKDHVGGLQKQLQDWINEGELMQGKNNVGT